MREVPGYNPLGDPMNARWGKAPKPEEYLGVSEEGMKTVEDVAPKPEVTDDDVKAREGMVPNYVDDESIKAVEGVVPDLSKDAENQQPPEDKSASQEWKDAWKKQS